MESNQFEPQDNKDRAHDFSLFCLGLPHLRTTLSRSGRWFLRVSEADSPVEPDKHLDMEMDNLRASIAEGTVTATATVTVTGTGTGTVSIPEVDDARLIHLYNIYGQVRSKF